MRNKGEPSNDCLVNSMKAICENDQLRRELLWLRAMEKGDDDCARHLETVEPGLRNRVTQLVDRKSLSSAKHPTEVYGQAYSDLLEAHLEWGTEMEGQRVIGKERA